MQFQPNVNEEAAKYTVAELARRGVLGCLRGDIGPESVMFPPSAGGLNVSTPTLQRVIIPAEHLSGGPAFHRS